jgi:hypothetical protein
MNRLSSPSVVMESQMNGHFENSSSSSSNSSAAYSSINPPSDIQLSSSSAVSLTTKPYKPKFHNYKKLDIGKATANMMPSQVAIIATSTSSPAGVSTPSTPSTPSFFGANAGQLVSIILIQQSIEQIFIIPRILLFCRHRKLLKNESAK